jgi:glycosyltransferase XagB
VRARTGSRLGAILVAAGLVPRRSLYRVLAREWGRPYLDLTHEIPDPDLFEDLELDALLAEQWLPVRRREDDRVVVASAEQPTPAWRDGVEARLGAEIDVHVTTDWDVATALLGVYRTSIADRASFGLWRRDGEQSARRVFSRPQAVIGILAVLALVVGLVVATVPTLVAASAVIGIGFLVTVGFKFVVCMEGARLEREEAITPEDVAALTDDELPTYTVLVPVFREANIVADLIGNLGDLDYPAEKLQILLLIEENDDETRDAALAANPPETISILTVPAGSPQTKPRACNVGLFFATGDLLVIYDAEDKPDRDQLKKAVIAFRDGDESLVCVQAALNYWNAEENALTRMFTLEYSFWFDYMLPGLDDLRLPIPLGGTSNHFRTDALRRLGGWDPFNVTEDADLGIRAAAMGATVGVINSTTFEEANRAYGNFVRQRSRWIKGYMQTTLVHLRHPVQLVRAVGLRAAIGFALLVGGTPLSFLFVPPLYAIFGISLLLPPDALAPYFPGWILWVSLLNLLAGNVLMIYVSMMGAFKRKRYRLVLWAVLNPLYWLLHSAASYKALWQLLVKPHYWEKTAHGLSALSGSHDPAAGDGSREPGLLAT